MNKEKLKILKQLSEDVAAWKLIRSKEDYKARDIQLFKNINVLIEKYNALSDSMKFSTIQISYTPEYLSGMLEIIRAQIKKEGK